MEQMLLEYSPSLLNELLKWCYSLTPLLFYIWWCFLLGIMVLEWFFPVRIFWKSYVKVVKDIWLFLSCSELYHTKLKTYYLQCVSFCVLISAVTFTTIMVCQACVLIKCQEANLYFRNIADNTPLFVPLCINFCALFEQVTEM